MKDFLLKLGILPVCFSTALLWLGMPGGGEFWPVLLVALVPLLYLARFESFGKRFITGTIAGLLYFVTQLYWIVIVLGRYGGLPWFFSYPALVLLCLYMALYFGFFTSFGGVLKKRWGSAGMIWMLPLLWVGLDWLRGVLFSGFPWMDLGYGMWRVPLLIQTADIFGHHFITFLLVLCNCLIFALLQRAEQKSLPGQTVLVILILLASVSYGHFRTLQLEGEVEKAGSAIFGIVQGNIDQSRKWSASEQQHTIDTYLDKSETLLQGGERPQVIVWPETALPFFPQRNPLIRSVQYFAVKHGVTLLTGSPWFEREEDGKGGVRYYNSAFIIKPDGEVGARYFKSHLVPFGEYVPLKKQLFFLAPLVEAVGDFTPGSIEAPLPAEGIKNGVLICFESIFPDIARDWANVGANVLVNLTNDAWYGRSSAPVQSLAMSILRAVETRRSLVRAANTGISAFVDPLGRVQGSSEIFEIWAASGKVALLETRTFYCRYGYLFGPLAALLSGVLLAFLAFGKRQAVS